MINISRKAKNESYISDIFSCCCCFFRLTQAFPNHIILAQVQFSQLLGVKKGYNYQSWLNRINRMSADFVVCNKDASIVAIIELDDATHHRADRRAAEIRVIRWQAKSIPDNIYPSNFSLIKLTLTNQNSL